MLLASALRSRDSRLSLLPSSLFLRNTVSCDNGRVSWISKHMLVTASTSKKVDTRPKVNAREVNILRHSKNNISLPVYNFAFAFICSCAFAKIGSIFVAFITFPLTFNFPLINKLCAFVFPVTIFPKFSSDNDNVTSAFLPSGATPLPTVPVLLRSMCQADSWPEAFLRTKAKMALPFFMASLRSASEDWREVFIASKAAEEGKEAVGGYVSGFFVGGGMGRVWRG